MEKHKEMTGEFDKPDVAILKDIPFPSEKPVQPGWIGKKYPQYTDAHSMHRELTSVRTAQHAGHVIKITTTYEIEVDGKTVHLHAMVGDDGQVHCHTTPYVQYHSAVELVKTLIDRFPNSFARKELSGKESPEHSEAKGAGKS